MTTGAQSLSARGVPGEIDGHVPNYNIFGQQHHRNPTKDKIHFAKNVKEKPEWANVPRYRTRSEMHAARRAEKYPDLSYDLDGDGAVGSTDYFIGKQFSREHDHRLNTGERKNAVHALENGWLDAYSFGHDQPGAKREFPVRQIRGKIISVDNVGDLSEVYPPHWNADKVPRFQTATDMAVHRRAELINAADKLKTDFDEKFPAFVPQPPVPRETTPLIKGQTNSARQEARRREAREYAGLDSDNTYVNPHRELQSGTTLDYNREPVDKTRSGMRERRKQEMREELQRTRREGESDYVPMVARHTWRDSVEYDERRPDAEALTMTKLRQQRRAEGIEHNMNNFHLHPVEHARYSDQAEPWWKLQQDYVHDAPGCSLKALKEPEKEIAGKVTETCPAPRGLGVPNTPSSLASRQRPPSNTEDELAHNAFDEADHRTLHRWTTEFVPQGLAQRVPRYFDGVKQAPTYSTDTAELGQFSSFEVIAKNSIRKDEARQRKAAKEDEERAHSWKLSIRGFPDHNAKEDGVAPGGIGGGAAASQPRGTGLATTGQQALGTPRESRTGSRPPQAPRIQEVNRIAINSEMLSMPLGEDPPMAERLTRIPASPRYPAARTSGGPSPISPTLATVDEQHASPAPLSPSSQPDALRRPQRPPSLGPRATDRTPPRAPANSTQPQRKSVPIDGLSSGRPQEAPGMVVRSSGFQWVERNTQHTGSIAEDASTTSLLRPPGAMPRDTSQHSLLQEPQSTAQSRSASRNLTKDPPSRSASAARSLSKGLLDR